MARKLRVEFSGAIYHVTLRGNGRMIIFNDDRDRERFLLRLEESADTYNVRVYMFCLMSNHVHLVVETPQANISRFMQSLTTGYTVYFNLKNNNCGHLFQGRFGAKLVEGDSYLSALTRYVHLNPVYIDYIKERPLKERIKILNHYKWSSYSGYVDESKELDFVDYGPVLALTGMSRRGAASKRYREFVETGIAQTDSEFVEIKNRSRLTIGSESFSHMVDELYQKLIDERDVLEDVSFRKQLEVLDVERVIQVICAEFGVKEDLLSKRQRHSIMRPVAAKMLCKFAGLTQRDTAKVLNLKSGSAVSNQLRKLDPVIKQDEALRNQIDRISVKLEDLRKQL